MNKRVFIAIKLDKQVVETIGKIQESLKKAGFTGVLVSKANFHVTLAFIGEVNENELQIIQNIIENIKFDAFKLEINNVKKFKNLMILELDKTEQLMALQKNIVTQLKSKNIKFDDKPYYPHITILRDEKTPSFEKHLCIQNDVNNIYLLSTERINGKIQYVEISKSR